MDTIEYGRSATDEVASAIATELASQLRQQRKYAVVHPTKMDSLRRFDLITLHWGDDGKSRSCFVACAVCGNQVVTTIMCNLEEGELWVSLESGDFVETILAWVIKWLRTDAEKQHARARRAGQHIVYHR